MLARISIINSSFCYIPFKSLTFTQNHPLQKHPVDSIVQTVIFFRQNDLRYNFCFLYMNSLSGDMSRTNTFFNFKMTGRSDGRPNIFSLYKPFGKTTAGCYVELPPLLFADLSNVTAAAFFALLADDAVFLGKKARALIADQTMGKDNGLCGCWNIIKLFPVIGIGNGGKIITNAQFFQK